MIPSLFDSHCHLQDPAFAADLPAVLDRAQVAGVSHMVCCGTREQDWPQVLAIRGGPVLAMLGLHPWFVAEARPGWLQRLREQLLQGRLGIGECGLDFAPGRPERDLQEAACAAQLRLAVELDLPVAIHCVQAWGRLPAILKQTGIPAAGAVVHAFSGSAESARELQALGLHLSFAGSITRPGGKRGPLALAATAADRLLLETDAPDLAPAGIEGDNQPANLLRVAAAAAQIRGEAFAVLAAQTHANACRVFRRLLP
jgi:TatD DNase family protein